MAKKFFNEIEAAKIAQNMERRGLEFYQKAAAGAKDMATRGVFLQLAEDEKKHLAQFEELEETLHAARREGAGYTDDADLSAYIDRLVETQVFADEGAVARLAEQATSDYEALAVAIRAERDTILFYQEMLDFIDSKAAREAFSRILQEERGHLETLGDQSEHCENFQG
ncbi:MAG TPA: ferritin family protein [Phycisphaerae bacterium]|nr:ferritin family protein [Phycisphaerae bacterium]